MSIKTAAFLILCQGTVWGQDAVSSFEAVGAKIIPGETLTLVDSSGTRFEGTLGGFSDAHLMLTVAGVQRRFPAAQIREISRRSKDPLGNGILIGAGIGAATGLLAPGVFCGGFGDSECGAIVRMVFVPLGAGIGAGAGALTDFFARRKVVVYVSPGRASAGLFLRF